MFSKRLFFVLSIALFVSGCESDEEKAERHFESAQALAAAGDVDRAIVELRNTFAADEGHREGRLLFGQLQKDLGNYRRAIRNYLRVAEEFPEDYLAVSNVAELSALLQAWPEAERHGRATIALDPENVNSRIVETVLDYRQALLDRDEGARAALITAAEGLADEKPDSLIIRNVLADGYSWQDDYEAALAQVNASLEYVPQYKPLSYSKLSILGQIGDEAAIEAHLRDMAASFPDDEDIKATMIQFLVATGSVDKAEAFFRDIADPTDGEIGPYVSLVQFLNETRGAEAAIAEIESTLDVVSDPALMRSIRAGLLFDLGDRAQAIAEMEEVVAADENDANADNLRVTLARMLMADGNEVGARRRVEEVLSSDPANVEAIKLQAVWLIDGDQPDDAIATLRAALGDAPDDVEAMLLLARAYNRAGNAVLSQDALSQAVAASGNAPTPSLLYAEVLVGNESFRVAEQVLVDALKLAPENLEILAALGQIYLQTGDYGRAEGVRDRLEGLDVPGAADQETRLRVALLAARERTGELLATLNELVDSSDGDERPLLALIQARLAQGEAGAALELAQDAVAENPDNPTLRMALAGTLLAAGDTPAAGTEYGQIIDDGLATGQTWRMLVNVLLSEQRQDDAIAAMKDGLAAFPDDPELLWMSASYRESIGDIDGAIGIYEQLYALDSNLLIVANNLASLLSTWRADDPAEVERAFQIARRLTGTDVPAFQDTIGWLLHLRGESAAAIEYLEPAAQALSNDPIVLYHLGAAYVADGRAEEGAEQLRAALTVAGDNGAVSGLMQAAQAQLDQIEANVGDPATDAN